MWPCTPTPGRSKVEKRSMFGLATGLTGAHVSTRSIERARSCSRIAPSASESKATAPAPVLATSASLSMNSSLLSCKRSERALRLEEQIKQVMLETVGFQAEGLLPSGSRLKIWSSCKDLRTRLRHLRRGESTKALSSRGMPRAALGNDTRGWRAKFFKPCKP